MILTKSESFTLIQSASWVSGTFLSFFFFFLNIYIYFLMWTIFKVFIEFVTILLLLFVFGCLAARHVGS